MHAGSNNSAASPYVCFVTFETARIPEKRYIGHRKWVLLPSKNSTLNSFRCEKYFGTYMLGMPRRFPGPGSINLLINLIKTSSGVLEE
jgi:hypothetical protein